MVANVIIEKMAQVEPEQMLAYVERRLAEWGHWFARGNFYGLGYPPCSIEYRLMREGIVRTSPAGQRPLPIHENAEQIEKLVQTLERQHPNIARALRAYYFRCGSIRSQAKAKGMSHTELQRQVQQARHWLAGWLTAMWENQRGKESEKMK